MALLTQYATGEPVQVGAAIFTDPLAPVHIIEEMDTWLDAHGVDDVRQIIGTVQPW